MKKMKWVCIDGTVYANGKELTDTGATRPVGAGYEAPAEDEDGNKYIITWDTTKEWDKACRYASLESSTFTSDEEKREMEELASQGFDVSPDVCDESYACDWGHPASVMDEASHEDLGCVVTALEA